eukprot:Gregarina_sp_Poly_1__802@NODE_1191_length_4820_cov_488_145382_g807_i1_p4_GENE_NODE_1191_length_4820_cov_488_145382_g807_i1NODE_1191_length_4820_cov_488_145382_g807_i1_p4_ORF_typecomplete_len171_score26_00DUF775/PF05603_12/1_7e39_NODE_1191_length_4820_cov_488_145382_g807_i129113423
MFGLVVPGRQLVTNFIRESETSWVCEIPNPREIANFALFFTDELPLDPPIGVSVYCSYVQPFTSWQFVGALSGARKSEIFTVGWPWIPEVNQGTIALKLVVEPAAAILEKLQTSPPQDIRKEFARKTAINLFRYLESFNAAPQLQNVLDAWFARFEQKYSVDPNFVLRSE